MGSSSTKIERENMGFEVNPYESPRYCHCVKEGRTGMYGKSPKEQIDSAMSVVKVCTKEAHLLQNTLKKKCFSSWTENCAVKEYNGFELSQMETLLRAINNNFAVTGTNIYNRLQGIKFAGNVDAKIFEFTFGEKFNTGEVYFGMVAISRENDVLNAISCLYTLNFKLARVLVTKTVNNTFLGFDISKDTVSWYESESLGFVTQRALVNFCRYKALREFKKRNLISRINEVRSLNGI